MNRYFKKSLIWMAVAWVTASVPGLAAQEPKTDAPPAASEAPQPQQPLTAAGIKDSKSVEAVVPYSNPAPGVTADSRPLSGFQNFSLGTNSATHSFLLPSFTVLGQVASNPFSTSQNSGTNISGSGTITGRLALNRVSSANTLTLDYLAGASFASGEGQGTSGIQSLDFSDSISHGRWSLAAGDALVYTSQSPFGFGGLGGLNGYGIPLGNGGVGVGSGAGSGTGPDQSILLDGAGRLSNGVFGQGDYALTHRSSITAGANYGVLKFFTNGLFNNSIVTAQSGYNYALSPQSSVSISYHYSRIMFSNGSPGFQDQGVSLGYGRRIASRLGFRVSAGPDIQSFTAPLKGPSTLVSWALSTSLDYSRGKLGLGGGYSHSVTGGSGVLGGAETDSFSGSSSFAFNRDWSASISGGYSKNRALEQTTLNASSIAPQAWFFSARASRHLFANSSVFISYGLTRQSSLSGICSQPACQVATTIHTGSIGYTWGLRQIILE
jgi:hypothetical protein